MKKVIYIKLTKIGRTTETFNIYDQFDNLIAADVNSGTLIDGIGYTVDDGVDFIKIVSTGACAYEKVVAVQEMEDADDFFTPDVELTRTGCVWEHLNSVDVYNSFYGSIHPYIIEYPFQYTYYDQILQSVKDYTKAFVYTADAKFSTAEYIETDKDYFNKAIIYNGQQCTGLLKLEPKPRRNLKQYMSYPKYNSDSKTITFAKSDNFYNYNMFWDVLKSKGDNIFISSTANLSIDKILNQDNMDYSKRSFVKSPIRAKHAKIRHILDNKNNVHLVSRMLFNSTQISYK